MFPHTPRAWKLVTAILAVALALSLSLAGPALASSRCSRTHHHRHNCPTLRHTARPAHASHLSTSLQAPKLSVSGNTLSWKAIRGVNSYVLVRKVPNQADEYSIVNATSVTPLAVPGVTVGFSVRTNVSGSSWAPEVSISYPALTTAPEATTEPTPTPTSQEPAKTEEPAPTPEPTPAPEPAPTPEPAPAPEGTTAPTFELGAVSGSAVAWELPFLRKLGAHTARMEFSIDTPASQLEPVVEAYAKAGIKPLLLAGFDGTMPSSAEARNLASWAAEFGPGGTFWKGKTFPANTAVTDIEFGNETSYAYQYSDTATTSNWYSLSSYKTRAQTYALRFKEANEAIHAAGATVGLLAQADDGGSGSSEWVHNMFLAVPNMGQIAAGWTIHPYGPKWESSINRLVSQTGAAGAPSTVPIFVTEWGLSTDNGRCLSDNYGFNKCMTYQEAATTLQSSVSAMRSRYGSRLAAFYLFQARDQSATGTSTGRESYFGALQSNEATKGAYTTTVESLLSANP
jgi:hypothetical protein